MFYLKVENRSDEGPRGKPPERTDLHVIESAKIRITVLTDKLYTFFLNQDSHVFIGESLAPLSDDEIIRIYKRIDHEPPILHNILLTFAVVDKVSGRTRVYKSICCNRPLYYHCSHRTIKCTSHIQLMKGDGVKLELNQEVLPEFFVYRYVMPPETLFKDIRCLPGGWSLVTEGDHKEISLRKLWNPEKAESNSKLSEAVLTTSKLLHNSIDFLKTYSETTVLMLSGGLDSSILGAISKNKGLDIKSISSGFHCITDEFGESEYALSAAKSMDFDHKIHDVSHEDYLSGLVDSLDVCAEPIHHLQSVILYSLFSKTSEVGARYLINGQGADGLFCHSSQYVWWKYKNILKLADFPFIKIPMTPLVRLLSRFDSRYRLFSYHHSDDHSRADNFIYAHEAYGNIGWVKKYFGVKQDAIVRNRLGFLNSFEQSSLLDKVSLLTFFGDVDKTMRIWGKLAEHFNSIVVYPFSYPDLINHSFRVPWDLKAAEPKMLLRNVAKHIEISDSIIMRSKKSFGFPIAYWALPGTLFQPLVDMAGEMFEKEELRSLQTIESSKAMILWGMINLYIWHKIFVDGIEPAELKREILERHRSLKKKAV